MAQFSFNSTSSTNRLQFIGISTQCVGGGPDGRTSVLARISLVDFRGGVVFDSFVSPGSRIVSNYWSSLTGIVAADLDGAPSFEMVQQFVRGLIDGKVLVGYSLWNDLSALNLQHSARETRDVALYMPFRRVVAQPDSEVPDLPVIVREALQHRISVSSQNSVENARACMDLYRSAPEWEDAISHSVWPCTLPPQNFNQSFL